MTPRTFCPHCENWTVSSNGYCAVCRRRKDPVSQMDEAIARHARKHRRNMLIMYVLFSLAVAAMLYFIGWVTKP